MVHADHDEPSFFNNPANQIQQQVYQLYRMAPPTKEEVFEYLDENPGALQEYLGNVHPAGLLGPFSPVFEQGAASEEEAASENEVQHSASDQGSFVSLFDGEQDDFWQLVAVAEQAGEEVEYEFPLELEGVDFDIDIAVVDEAVPQAGPEVPLDNVDDNSVANHDLDPTIDSDSDDDANGVTPSCSEDEAEYASETDSDDNIVDNTTKNTTPVATPIAAADSPDPNFIPYPAPAHLIAESRVQPPSRSWALWEEDSCIRHMLDIDRENQLRGEARFHEALHRMRTIDNCTRDRPNAVKNFWNRVGRARSGLDERRNKSAPLATSRQGKQAQTARTVPSSSSSSSSPSTTLVSRKKRHVSSSRRVTKPRTSTKRRQKTREYSSEEDEESEFPLESDNEEPIHLRHSRKRKDDDDDDSEDDWQPTPGYVNAVAEGLRTPKKARTAAE